MPLASTDTVAIKNVCVDMKRPNTTESNVANGLTPMSDHYEELNGDSGMKLHIFFRAAPPGPSNQREKTR